MKILAISSGGDPLFVRDDHGRAFEVEVRWATDARHRRWAEDTESYWDGIWESVFNGSPVAGIEVPPSPAVKFGGGEPLLVKPAFRFLAAHLLPPLEERDEHERRARTLERLGGNVPDDDVVTRRAETHRREWSRTHPKALPSHPSVWSPESYLLPGSMPRFTNIAAQRMEVPFMQFSVVTAPAAADVETIDAVQARRAEAMRRLQDPPAPDPSIERDIKYMLDGLHRRPVL